jgi:hypothetical protein
VKNASGHHRDEARWPFLPLAAPRGVRELLWHVGVLLAIVSPLVPPMGVVVFAEVIALTWLLEMRPADLMKLSAELTFLGVLIATMFSTPSTYFVTIVHVFTWSRASQVGLALAIALGYCIELSVAALAVAILMSFDRRRVHRTTVDLRVWQRQQTRRRQLLRRWHRSRDLPEVTP